MQELELYGLRPEQLQELDGAIGEIFENIQIKIKKLCKRIQLALKSAFSDLHAAARDLAQLLADAFTVDTAAKLQKSAAIYGKTLALSLYGIQTDLEGLRAAIIRAFSPIAALLVPVVKQAIRVLTGFANSVYQVLSALFGAEKGLQQFTGGMRAAVSAGTALKRTVAGFDELNRLGDSDGGLVSSFIGDLDTALSPGLQAVVTKLHQLLEPLQKIDLSPLAESFRKLRQALEPIKKALFSGLEWAWNNLFVPLAKWTAEELLPVFLEALTTALQGLNQIITQLQPEITWLWENFLKPLAQWAGTTILQELKHFNDYLKGIGDWISSNQGPVDSFISSIRGAVTAFGDMNQKAALWNQLAPTISGITRGVGLAVTGMMAQMGNSNAVMNGISLAIQALTGDMEGLGTTGSNAFTAFAQGWSGLKGFLQSDVKDPMRTGFQDIANMLIGFLNKVIDAAAQTVNMVIDALNQMSFTVPFWVPLLGGKRFGFDLDHVSAPQIPYLAKGAVLPANRPFMAVVGDQRHGTNVEAPLATIQEALQNVLSGELGGVMEGFRAVTERQERILNAIYGIEFSDTAVGMAAQRYERKMAVITGGL